MIKLKDLIKEADGHPQLLNKNKEVAHNWATHMEWKSSTDKNKYGNVVGEVIHHTLFEDGTITKYDVKFGNRIVKNIPTEMLEACAEQSHSHEADGEYDKDKKKKKKKKKKDTEEQSPHSNYGDDVGIDEW